MSIDIKISVPETFFQEETRCDYVISSKMKKVWAIELDLLAELKRVCQKYNLIYYADSGTLIGAIRHQGFIPWDDDIDVVMKRKDYNKLIEVAAKEFNEPYYLQSAHSEKYPKGYAKLRNSSSTAITRNDMNKYENCGIFIDIFPLDNVPDNQNIRKRWLKKIKNMYMLIKSGCNPKGPKKRDVLTTLCFYGVKGIMYVWGYDRMVSHYEKICSKYNNTNTQKISYVAHTKGKEKHIWDRDCFDTGYLVKFEFTDIYIPGGYDSRLKTEYQDYMKLVHSDTAHGNMILEPEIPYRYFLERHDENELKRFFIL